METYKGEIATILERLMAGELTYLECTAALHAASAAIAPRLNPEEVAELRPLILSVKAVVRSEMQKRGGPEWLKTIGNK